MANESRDKMDLYNLNTVICVKLKNYFLVERT